MTQVGNWTDTGVEMPLRQGANQISIIYALDYKNHTLNFVAVVVNGKTYNLSLPPIPAQQIGWALSKFVTQLQMCTGANGGCYDLLFTQMSYSGN